MHSNSVQIVGEGLVNELDVDWCGEFDDICKSSCVGSGAVELESEWTKGVFEVCAG